MTNTHFLSKPTDGTLIHVNLSLGLIYHEISEATMPRYILP